MSTRWAVTFVVVALSVGSTVACSSTPVDGRQAASEKTSGTEPEVEQPSLLDYSNLLGSESFTPYEIASPEQLRDLVAATVVGDLVSISAGYPPDAENWGMFPGTFIAHFEVRKLLGGQLDPGPMVEVAIRLDRPPADVPSTLETLRAHLGETYLLFLTPEYARVTGEKTGRFVLAPEAPVPLLQVDPAGALRVISNTEQLLGDAIKRGEQMTGTTDPTRDDPIDESTLDDELRETYLGSILDHDRAWLESTFVAPTGKNAAALGIRGDQRLVEQAIERNRSASPPGGEHA